MKEERRRNLIQILSDTIGFERKDAEQFTDIYLAKMEGSGNDIPFLGNVKLKDITLYGGIFVQIEQLKGHKAVIDEQEVHYLKVVVDNEIYTATDGEDYWKVYIAAPELKKGGLIAVYENCDTSEIIESKEFFGTWNNITSALTELIKKNG